MSTKPTASSPKSSSAACKSCLRLTTASARTSFTYSNDKRSSYKVFAYGDTVNHRWIEPRKGDWKLIGNAFNRNDALHTALYQAFCIDGMPTTVEGLVQRLKERGGRHGTTLTKHDK